MLLVCWSIANKRSKQEKGSIGGGKMREFYSFGELEKPPILFGFLGAPQKIKPCFLGGRRGFAEFFFEIFRGHRFFSELFFGPKLCSSICRRKATIYDFTSLIF